MHIISLILKHRQKNSLTIISYSVYLQLQLYLIEDIVIKKYHICLDTCVYISLASGRLEFSAMKLFDKFLGKHNVTILLPEIIKTEWKRNIEQENIKAYQKKNIQQINDLKGRIDYLRLDSDPQTTIAVLDDLTKATESYFTNNILKIESYFTRANTILIPWKPETSTAIVEMGLNKKKPFGSKNGTADAVILTSFINYIKERELHNCYFVSENTSDFSDPHQVDNIHPDLVDMFTSTKAFYFRNILEFINHADSGVVPETIIQKTNALIDGGICFNCSSPNVTLACRRSRYGGLTEHIICLECGKSFDTGDPWD